MADDYDILTTPPRPRPTAWWTVIGLAARARPLEALRGLAALALRKRTRGWNILSEAASLHQSTYARWISRAEPARFRDFKSEKGTFSDRSIAALILDDGQADHRAAGLTRDALRAALGQGADVWTEIADLAGCRSIASASPADLVQTLREIAAHGARWLLVVRAGDLVSPLLGDVAARIEMDGQPILYWDEDRLVDGERVAPLIKPDWDPILFRAFDGLTGACILNIAKGEEILEVQTPYNGDSNAESVAALIIMMATQNPDSAPVHVPLILTHRAHDFIDNENRGKIVRSVWPIMPPDLLQPSVSIIIPTRDRIDLLDPCLDSLSRLPGSLKYEIVIVDNGSTEEKTLHLFEEIQKNGYVTIVSHPGDFNFASLINAGAAVAKGDVLCLLNNDVEAMDGYWLQSMASYAVRPDIGAVGARLIYPDGVIQHAGVALGIGGAAGHVDKGVRPDRERRSIWHDFDKEVSAVTGACLVVARDKFLAVEGMDAQAFAVDFNDVDLCLRLRERGWKTVYCANAELIHKESRSRGSRRVGGDLVRFERELATLRSRWQTDRCRDPHHSPLFRRASERCLLAF